MPPSRKPRSSTVAVKKSAKKVAKKAPAKRATKKVAAKKKVAKKVAKKAPAKKVAKKVAKKAPAKRAAKKVAKKTTSRSPQRIVIPPVPVTGSKNVTSISTTPPAKSTSSAPAMQTTTSNAPAKQTTTSNAPAKNSSSRVVVTVIAGIALLAVAVVSRNHSTTTTPAPAASASADASMEATPAASASSDATAAAPAPADATHAAPEGIVAHYTSTGATIFWTAPAGASGLTNYNVEIASNGGAWKLISTVPASQLSLDITKGDTTGWCSFRVSAVYSDGKVVGGKVFGLPGQYA